MRRKTLFRDDKIFIKCEIKWWWKELKKLFYFSSWKNILFFKNYLKKQIFYRWTVKILWDFFSDFHAFIKIISTQVKALKSALRYQLISIWTKRLYRINSKKVFCLNFNFIAVTTERLLNSASKSKSEVINNSSYRFNCNHEF